MSTFDLARRGAVVLVTGGASGIGRAVAEVFGEAEYRVVIADIDRDRGEEAAADLSARGVETRFVKGDVSVEAQACATVRAAIASWGRLDCLYNGAGIAGRHAAIEALDEGDLERVLAVDLKSVFYMCKHAVPRMRTQGGGVILNVASITAETGSAYFAGYGAAKAGVIALTRGLARHHGRYNIRINCLNPGSVSGTNLMDDFYATHAGARDKEMHALMQKIPVGHAARPRDIAHVALFLASPFAAHVHGAVVTIDGGEMLRYQ